MAEWWIDDTAGGVADGTNPTDAWASVNDQAGQVAGDDIYIRRGHSETLAADFAPAPDGTRASPINWIAWPRNAKTGTGDWLNGSFCVTDVDFSHATDPLVDRGLYMGRLIKNDADGKWYFITAVLVKQLWDGDTAAEAPELELGDIVEGVTSGCWGKIHKITDNGDGTGTFWAVTYNATTGLPDHWDNNEHLEVGGVYVCDANGDGVPDGFHLDKEFAGTTEGNGNTTVQKDEGYDARDAQGKDDVGTNVDWDADTGGLPILDFAVNVNGWYMNALYYNRFFGFDVRNGQDTIGLIQSRLVNGILYKYMLIHKIHNSYLVSPRASGSHKFRQCIITGNYIGASQVGLRTSEGCNVDIKDVAIYNCGDFGITDYAAKKVFADNLIVGRELPNGDASIYTKTLKGKDIYVDNTNGGIEFDSLADQPDIHIENYQQVLGEQFSMKASFNYSMNAGGGADVNLRAGGSSSVIDIAASSNLPATDDFSAEIFNWLFTGLSAGVHTIKVYVQNTAAINTSDAVNAADFWLEVDYVEKYDDASEYTYGKHADGFVLIRSTSSNNPMPIRADVDDWDEYLTITFTLAVASNVYLRLMSGWYDAGEHIYVDINPDVS